jgi:hypothetical protein
LESKANKARHINLVATLNDTVINGTGATITATDGVHTYTAIESSGRAVIAILSAGTYTVTATLSGQIGTITDTVVIDTYGRTYTAEVGFISTQIPSDLVKNNTLYYTGYGESFYGNSINTIISDELYNFIITDEKYALRQGILVNLLSAIEGEIFILQFPCEPRYENGLLTGIRNIGNSLGYWYNWRPAQFNSGSNLFTKDYGQWWSHVVAPGDYITDLRGWRYLNI